MEPGNGHGEHYVHVKPGPKRIERFKRRLAETLTKAKPGVDRFAVGNDYWRKWFNSQQAWTKVPFWSEDLSSFLTFIYIQDFNQDLPMGVWKVNKPMSKSIDIAASK